MPDGFEYIVRPYQSPGSQGGIIIPATPRGTRERAHLTWGGKGTMPNVRLTQLDFNTQKSPHDEVLTEKDRQSDIIRIEQPGVPENYVDVARAKQVRLSKEENMSPADMLAEQQYVASGLDPRLEGYHPNIVSGGEDKKLSRATWNMKNAGR